VLIVINIFVYIFLSTIVILILGDNYLVIKNSKPKKTDVIIVLGYPANKDGSPSKVITERVNKGVELLKSGYASRILLTGGGNPIESQVMATYARELGVEENIIFQESKAKTTIQNAINCIEIMKKNGWQTALVVTSPYHSRRAYLIFKKYNLEFVIIPSQSINQINAITRVNDILHELFSFVGDFFQEKFNRSIYVE